MAEPGSHLCRHINLAVTCSICTDVRSNRNAALEEAAKIAENDWENLNCPYHYSGMVARLRGSAIAMKIRAMIEKPCLGCKGSGGYSCGDCSGQPGTPCRCSPTGSTYCPSCGGKGYSA